MIIDFSHIRTKLPSTPGVYFFKALDGTILYIGKASNLKARVSSYFAIYRDLTPAKERMLRKAHMLEWRQVGSEIEALILEASLIKRYSPAYNILMRDDKNYTFVGFTKEPFPRMLITHQPLDPPRRTRGEPPSLSKKTRQGKHKKIQYLGPFTDGTSIKSVLKQLRRVFPYCTCKEMHSRRCQQAALGLCLTVCCLDISKARPELSQEYPPDHVRDLKIAYKNNVRIIREILSGKHTRILSRLKKEMEVLSIAQEFEKAATTRNHLWALERIFAHSPYISAEQSVENEKGARYLQHILGRKNPIERIEGYDISNILGTDAVGSMVVFIDGRRDAAAYRKFKIKTVRGANDPAMMQEILLRRLRHSAWRYPDVMLIDGGRTQLNAALRALSQTGLDLATTREIQKHLGDIQIVSVAKREEELYLPSVAEPIKLKSLPSPLLHLIQQIRDESHRFAISYHRKLHRKLS